jgi:hypothetical protein
MPSLQFYLEQAETTCQEIRSQLTFGSNSEIDVHRSDLKRFFALRWMQLFTVADDNYVRDRNDIEHAYMQISPLIIKKYGYGHCGEIARAGLLNLVNKGVYPVEICSATKSDHSFLILGRAPGSDLQNSNTWGKQAVVCDIWANQVYPAIDFLSKKQAKSYLNVLKEEDQPHYLSGTLKIQSSMMTERDLILFKQKKTISKLLLPLFLKPAMSDQDLKDDLAQMRTCYQQLQADNQVISSELQKNFGGLCSQLQPQRQTVLPFRMFEYSAINSRPLACVGWSEPPPGSYQDEEGRTIAPK